MNEISVINQALNNIFRGIGSLKETFPGKEFTIDGRLVGDLGEVIAALHYDIGLFQTSQPSYDGQCSDGKMVQIKATFKDSLTFGTLPDYYLGLKLFTDGHFEEIFNGPGEIIYDRYRHRKDIGVKLLSFPNRELLWLSRNVSPEDRIKKRQQFNSEDERLQWPGL